MEIKKDSNSKLTIKIDKSKVMIDFDSSGHMDIYVGDNKLERPGEYEYSHINFRLSENKESGFESKVNLASIHTESNINVLVLMNNLSVQETEFGLSDINILITNVFDPKEIKTLLKKVKPEQILLLNNFIGKTATEEEIKKVKSEMNFNIAPESKMVFDEVQFNTEEDMATQTYIFE